MRMWMDVQISQWVEQGVIQWKGAMWLRRRVGKKEVKPGFIQFISVFVVDVVWVLDFF
jgi:hypothetical protein